MISNTKYSHFCPPQGGVWLVDNGSLRPESFLELRRRAAALGELCGLPVEPVSVLHSAKIDPAELGGQAAETFVAALRRRAQEGLRELAVLPYFFGPSAALTEYLPYQIERLREEFPSLRVRLADPLVHLADPADDAPQLLAEALAQNVREALEPLEAAPAASASAQSAVQSSTPPRHSSQAVTVIMVDHGSPQAAVSQVRDCVGALLRQELTGLVATVGIASMEAREGDLYAHAQPLLAQVLDEPPFCNSRVLIAPLFLGPGRHAGPGGDLERIAAAAREKHPALQTAFCRLPGASPQVAQILLRRLQEVLDCVAAERLIDHQ